MVNNKKLSKITIIRRKHVIRIRWPTRLVILNHYFGNLIHDNKIIHKSTVRLLTIMYAINYSIQFLC